MTQSTGKCEKCGKPLSDPNAKLCDRCQLKKTGLIEKVLKVIVIFVFAIIGIIVKGKFGQKK